IPLPAIPLTATRRVQYSRDSRFTAMDAWVDSNGVLRRLAWTVAGPSWYQFKIDSAGRGQVIKTGAKAFQQVVVTFLAIGQPQRITVPPNAIPASESDLMHCPTGNTCTLSRTP
ncbi:MAG: hypothetical protein J2P27_12000, partial [Actinobacteria bacterium]|nr:hypothetical protein [Actinomycetota bacterium]